ncbi:DsbA family protein [Myxococcota bacterium]|nr:DsbA family protein [Myxococcota bacterium]MCZ7618161.1 DsbA family protein [Myxococcota bacterium]
MGLVLFLVVACSPPQDSGSPAAGPSTQRADAEQLAGRIAGQEVRVGDLDAWIMGKLYDNATGNGNPSRLFEIRKRALEQMASEQALEALATERGKSKEDLLREEIDQRAAVDDAEVQAFYEQNKERYGKREFDKVEAVVRRQLEQQKRQGVAQKYLEGLRAELGFESLLEAPRFEITGDGPARGPADAPITLVEFSDYQCPFCKNAEPIIDQVLERYPTQVRVVFRQFPLDNIHPQARGAAEAALCAREQGKFWEYHEKLFEGAPKLGEEELKRYADEAGLDRAAFDACRAEEQQAAAVQADVEAGEHIGVAGTPAFYVNGRPLAGARSVEQFAALIDEELERLGLAVPTTPQPAAPPAPPAPAAP